MGSLPWLVKLYSTKLQIFLELGRYHICWCPWLHGFISNKIALVEVLGWELLSQFPLLCYFRDFSPSSNDWLPIEYHVHVWQVCDDTGQIWKWFKESFNSLRPRRNRRHFADDIFKCIFLNENVWISLKISLKFVPKVQINNIPTLVQIVAWRRPGDKPLSEPMLVILLTHICVTRPQWVKLINRARVVTSPGVATIRLQAIN